MIALSALSIASWKASLKGEKIGVILGEFPYRFSMDLSGVFFCLGMAGTSIKYWEIGAWLALAILFLAHLVGLLIKHRAMRSNTLVNR